MSEQQLSNCRHSQTSACHGQPMQPCRRPLTFCGCTSQICCSLRAGGGIWAHGISHLPGIEVEGCELAKVGVRHVHIEGLALINEGSTVSCHVHQDTLLDLPHSLIQRLQIVWNVKILRHISLTFLHDSGMQMYPLSCKWQRLA